MPLSGLFVVSDCGKQHWGIDEACVSCYQDCSVISFNFDWNKWIGASSLYIRIVWDVTEMVCTKTVYWENPRIILVFSLYTLEFS